jgi:probable phosphoglycerate mutase
MRIYIIRHADPDYINDTLTPAGHEQAQVLAQYLQTLKINEIYTSPLGRTQATARYTASRTNLSIQTEPWMHELADEWIEDLNQACVGIARLRQPVSPQIFETRQKVQLSQPDPCLMEENMDLIRRGSDKFMRRQGFLRQGDAYQVVQENRKAIAVFTHMGVALVWLAHLLDIPLPMMWSGFFLHPASITTILMDERQQGFAIPRCIGLGDISHLCKAGLYPRPVGMFANSE